ncbi:MAG: AAA family ATPase, partial [Spirochaetota bacterium]
MDYLEIERLTAKVKNENGIISSIKNEISKVIVGQDALIDRIIVAFLCDGHILVEGLPGLAKTLAVRAFARTIDASFSRIQFTPDLLPADLTGTQIYNPKDLNFFVRKGPVFTNILLADEINRAPAKVQSALLQSMEERLVTIGDSTFPLPKPFMVLATENPIEQEGTYPLPEAQLDRFFMKCLITYPDKEDEKQILRKHKTIDLDSLSAVCSAASLESAKQTVESIYVDEKLIDYIVTIVQQTRKPVSEELVRYVEFGASPRASIALMKAARCIAFIRGRGFVTPDDIKEIAPDVLRH